MTSTLLPLKFLYLYPSDQAIVKLAEYRIQTFVTNFCIVKHQQWIFVSSNTDKSCIARWVLLRRSSLQGSWVNRTLGMHFILQSNCSNSTGKFPSQRLIIPNFEVSSDSIIQPSFNKKIKLSGYKEKGTIESCLLLLNNYYLNLIRVKS